MFSQSICAVANKILGSNFIVMEKCVVIKLLRVDYRAIPW